MGQQPMRGMNSRNKSIAAYKSEPAASVPRIQRNFKMGESSIEQGDEIRIRQRDQDQQGHPPKQRPVPCVGLWHGAD